MLLVPAVKLPPLLIVTLPIAESAYAGVTFLFVPVGPLITILPKDK